MPRPKRSMESEMTIDGVKLVWRLHREQQRRTADRWKGVAVQVCSADGDHRELLLEYPVIHEHKSGWTRPKLPVRPRLHPAKIENHIRLAVVAG